MFGAGNAAASDAGTSTLSIVGVLRPVVMTLKPSPMPSIVPTLAQKVGPVIIPSASQYVR